MNNGSNSKSNLQELTKEIIDSIDKEILEMENEDGNNYINHNDEDLKQTQSILNKLDEKYNKNSKSTSKIINKDNMIIINNSIEKGVFIDEPNYSINEKNLNNSIQLQVSNQITNENNKFLISNKQKSDLNQINFDVRGNKNIANDFNAIKNYEFADLKQWQEKFSWDELVTIASKYIFNHKKFRTNQREIINALVSGRDLFVNMPTGGGKSLTFQLPAMISKGTTIVIMPLISLINDQIKFINKLGVKALFIKDDYTFEKNFILKNFEIQEPEQRIKLIYLTPEKLFLSESTYYIIKKLYEKNLIDRFVIDEVHCIAQWGKDFRPEYLSLKRLKKEFPSVPILTMTATANIEIRDEIINFLELEKCLIFRSSYNRANIYLEVRDKTKYANPLRDIATFIKAKYPLGSGIIYCSSRKQCESIASKLKIDYGFSTDYYFSTISEKQKLEVQENFMNGKIQILIATIAFGMGINKENIRFVIHYSLPKSFENYYQEIGRAGRDGKRSDAILYYNINERRTLDYLLSKSNGDSQVKSSNLRKINQIISYCEEKAECRRVLALKYFGEVFTEEKCDKMCDNCNNSIETVDVDVSKLSITIIEFFNHLRFQNFKMTINQAASYLKGVKLDKFKCIEYKIQKDNKYFSLLKSWDLNCITKLIRTLILKHYLKETVECFYENVCCYIELDILSKKYLEEKKNLNNLNYHSFEDLKIILTFQYGKIKSYGLSNTGCIVLDVNKNHNKLYSPNKQKSIKKKSSKLVNIDNKSQGNFNSINNIKLDDTKDKEIKESRFMRYEIPNNNISCNKGDNDDDEEEIILVDPKYNYTKENDDIFLDVMSKMDMNSGLYKCESSVKVPNNYNEKPKMKSNLNNNISNVDMFNLTSKKENKEIVQETLLTNIKYLETPIVNSKSSNGKNVNNNNKLEDFVPTNIDFYNVSNFNGNIENKSVTVKSMTTNNKDTDKKPVKKNFFI